MPGVPSLITLCIGAIKDAILDENGNLSYVYKLPSELFDQILPNLPPLALQNLQEAMPLVSSNDPDDCLQPSRKRKRLDNFDVAWKALYNSRWSDVQKISEDLLPEDVQENEPITNWQQIYWERHLQNCLDAVAETVAITLFDGFLGEVEIPDNLLKPITNEEQVSRPRSYLKLTYHCQRFGQYARRLRLRSVHCVAEIAQLLRKSQLEYLEIHWLKSKEQVEGLCKLLNQNKEILASVEFVHCKLIASLFTALCESIHEKGCETNVLKKFSIKSSSFLDSSCFPLPIGLDSLVFSASGLTKLELTENRMWWKTAKLLFEALIDADSCLQVLDLSDNNIAGWLSQFKWGSPNCFKTDGQIDKSLKHLRVLNLRNNNLQKDDADCLKYAMVYMPNLVVLNLSENPLQGVGISILTPYLIEKSKSDTPLAELSLENCDLNCNGAIRLLKDLATFEVPLKSLSIGDNHLGSKFGPTFGKLLSSGIQAIDVRGINLGLLGFEEAQKEITKELSIVHINISANGGGDRTANFFSKVISKAPKLISVKANNNWITEASIPVICSSLKTSKGKLELLDFRRNPMCIKEDIVSLFGKFQINGKPNILLSPLTVPEVAHVYDNDP